MISDKEVFNMNEITYMPDNEFDGQNLDFSWNVIKNINLSDLFESIEHSNNNSNLSNVKKGNYRINPPLIKPSKLASKEKGGIGKDLSEGWGINFSIGCLHSCIFCYADQIHKRRLGGVISGIPWGNYFFLPENFDEALYKTPWEKWKGKEVLMSSTHDPYLSQNKKLARKILEIALPKGVKFCIQTRSFNVLRDLDLIKEYKNQIRLQVSIATLDYNFYKLIEPFASPPNYRMRVIKEFREANVETGVIVAPLFPSNMVRPDFEGDLGNIFEILSEIRPNRIFGETLHRRGGNMVLINRAIGKSFSKDELMNFDHVAKDIFINLLNKYRLKGDWWPEFKKH